MEKKNPYKFTLGFDKTKPTHVRAAEILNSVRDKADLIASAVVAHIDGGSTEKGAVLNQEALQIMMLELVKQDVEKVLAKIGLNSTTAITMFYSQIKLHQGLPFDARIPNAETKAAIKEARSGKSLKRYDSAAAMFEDLDG